MTTQLLVDALGRDDQFEMVESLSNSSALLGVIKAEKPEIAVVSAHLEKSKGFELIREIRVQSPATRIIVLLDSSERSIVIEAFKAGAMGVFCRTEPFRLLSKCIQCVNDGQIWANSNELRFVLEALAQPPQPAGFKFNDGLLSARETEVVQCVAEGLTNREIAQRLKLTEHTVKNYLFRIFDKLGVSSRVEVVLYAFRNGNAAHASPAASSARQSPRPITALARAADKGPVPVRKTAT